MIKLVLGQVCLKKKGKYECRRIPHNFSNRPVHWSVKYKWGCAWKQEVCNQVMINRKRFGKLPLKMPRITIVLYAVVQFDKDNSYSACKHLVDGLKREWSGVIEDDSIKHVTLEVEQRKVNHKIEERVEIIFN